MASFPTSKYVRYKRATAFFLDWLLRARGRGRRSGKRVQLDAFNAVVQEITEKPFSLTPKLLGELPKALAACRCAITFREHVAAFFADDDEAQVGHRHFLELLKRWYNSLRQLEQQPRAGDDNVKSERFENYYEVLWVDEDYFPDEETTFTVEKGASKKAKVDRERVFEQAFAEDLRLEIAYFFLEMEELVEEVYNIYTQVKKQERTMMEATVVVKVAMDLAESLTVGLQFRYPALQTAEDLLFVLLDHPSTSLRDQIAKTAADVREKFELDGTYAFAPGMLLNDFTNVWWTLTYFSSAVGTKEDRKDTYWNFVVLPDGYYGEQYGEERTPHHVLPNSNNMIVFLVQQLPLLYNTIRRCRIKRGSGYKRGEMVSSFMALFDEYFQTRKITIQLVFTCVLWLKSVAALQGSGGLSRNVSLTFDHARELMEKMEIAVAKDNTPLSSLMQDCVVEIKDSARGHALARTNPLLAGFMMTTYHIKFLLLASGAWINSKMIRAFGHLYNALVNEGFLQRIPFFDELLAIYEDVIFTPSPAAAVHGCYNRAYLLSGHHSPATVDSVYRGVIPPTRPNAKNNFDHHDDSSMTYRLLFENDMACLRGVSPKAMLKKAATICSKDLFTTRILSRDLMTLNDDLLDTFSEMCDVLGRRKFHDDYVADPVNSKARQNSINYGLVDSVMVPLLALLDARQADDSMKRSALPVGMLTHRECAVSGEEVRTMGEKVATVIKARFAATPRLCDLKYFTFPLKPDYVSQEYGTNILTQKSSSLSREQVFYDLMTLMKSSRGPLSGDNLSYLKTEIKTDPEILGEFSPCTAINSGGNSNMSADEDLCTLLHQAAAGPAHDLHLVEWMIQMGALIYQPMHCRKQELNCELAVFLETMPNAMALHSAVIAGYNKIARMMLEADNLIDLNTPTFHTKETLSHLAVKYGHRDLLHVLRCFGANVHIKDGSGNRVQDMAAERGWSAERAEIAATTPNLKEIATTNNDDEEEEEQIFDVKLCRQLTLRAKRLQKLIFVQPGEDQRRILENIGIITETGVRRPSKQRKGKRVWKSNGVMSPTKTNSDPVETPNVDSASYENTKDDCLDRTSPVEKSIAKTSIVFERLRNPTIPGNDKSEDVEYACKVVERLEGMIEVLSDPNTAAKQHLLVKRNIAFEAYRVIHMMHKFHRVDHTATKDPILTPFRWLCSTTPTFTKFVVRTAQLCGSVSRKSHASELLFVLEKRLLKAHAQGHDCEELRRLYELYTGAHDTLGLERSRLTEELFFRESHPTQKVLDKDEQMVLGNVTGSPIFLSSYG